MKKQQGKRLTLTRETLKALGTVHIAAGASITVCGGGNPTVTNCSLGLCSRALCEY